MENNSDDDDGLYERLKDFDFSNARPARENPIIAKYQAEHAEKMRRANKTRITIWIDNSVMDAFRDRAVKEDKGYQTLMNEALRSACDAPAPAAAPVTEDLLRRILREELHKPEERSAA